jgi:hypothetical protein
MMWVTVAVSAHTNARWRPVILQCFYKRPHLCGADCVLLAYRPYFENWRKLSRSTCCVYVYSFVSVSLTFHVCPSICVSVIVYSSVCSPFGFYPSVYLRSPVFVSVSVCPCACLSVSVCPRVCISVSICPFVCLSVSVRSSVWPSFDVYPSVCLRSPVSAPHVSVYPLVSVYVAVYPLVSVHVCFSINICQFVCIYPLIFGRKIMRSLCCLCPPHLEISGGRLIWCHARDSNRERQEYKCTAPPLDHPVRSKSLLKHSKNCVSPYVS